MLYIFINCYIITYNICNVNGLGTFLEQLSIYGFNINNLHGTSSGKHNGILVLNNVYYKRSCVSDNNQLTFQILLFCYIIKVKIYLRCIYKYCF